MIKLQPPTQNLRNIALYDLEVYPNYFLVCVRIYGDSVEGDGPIEQHVFRVDDRAAAKKMLLRKDVWHVGHNTLGYDDIMLLCWLSGATQGQLFQLNQYLIPAEKITDTKLVKWVEKNVNTRVGLKFGKASRDHSISFRAPAVEPLHWNDRHVIDTLILGEKQGSLKNAAIVLGIHDLVEAPVEFGKVLTREQTASVDKYCWHDIEITDKLIRHYAKNLEIRSRFANLGIDQAYRVGSAKLAELYLLNRHMDSIVGEARADAWLKNVKQKAKEFNRPSDKITDLVGDYKFSFYDEGFAALWSMLSQAELVYPSSPLTAETDCMEGEDESDWVNGDKEPSPFRIGESHIPKGSLLIADARGMGYKVGIGGLHNDAPRGVWKSTKTHTILLVDVKSYYPSLIASNGYAPRQFPEMAKIEGALKVERVSHKDAGRNADADALKLVLNAAFGKMKDKFSPLYDPKAHFSVTISGQLLLLKLIDMVYIFCPSAELINANTDGLAFRLAISEIPALKVVMKEWERFAKVELDTEEFSVWAQSSCNNYCAKKPSGKIKSKGGDYKVYPMAMRETMRVAPAIKKMVIDCLIEGVHPDETAKRLLADKPTDFLFSSAFGKTSPLYGGERMAGRRSLRYAWSDQGKMLQTEQKNGIKVHAEGKKVILVDDLDAFDPKDLSVNPYVEKAMTQVLRVVMEYTTLDLPAKVKREIGANFETWYNR